jgi:hypothetical protein
MKVAILVGAVLFAFSHHAWAQDDPCKNPFTSIPRTYPFGNTLRWDLALSAGELSHDWHPAATANLGVAKIVDVSYQSFDLGAHASIGTSLGDVSALFETAEAEGRFYPVKLRQTFGLDQCGDGTKTRRWSEHTDGVGYLLARAGYGHAGGGVPSHSTILLTPGFGYEQNLGDGRLMSLFFQLAWRFDLLTHGASFPLGGPFLEVGFRV